MLGDESITEKADRALDFRIEQGLYIAADLLLSLQKIGTATVYFK